MAAILSIGSASDNFEGLNALLVSCGHSVFVAATRTSTVAAMQPLDFNVALICELPAGYANSLAGDILKVRPQCKVLVWESIGTADEIHESVDKLFEKGAAA